jgi:hypothetical protein
VREVVKVRNLYQASVSGVVVTQCVRSIDRTPERHGGLVADAYPS